MMKPHSNIGELDEESDVFGLDIAVDCDNDCMGDDVDGVDASIFNA